MQRRFATAMGLSALLLIVALQGTTAARSPERFGRVDTGGRTPHLDGLPSRQDPDRRVGVYVELAGTPVSVRRGRAIAAGGTLSTGATLAARRSLATEQAAVRVRLAGLGAHVEATYTEVLNGFRITVPARQIPRIRALPGVTRVSPVLTYERDNANTVSYLGADTTWGATGFTGAGVKIAIIDSGINYYHRDFGGPTGWGADDGLDRSDGHFPTAKVIGGYDLVGDDYDGSMDSVPQPDNDPLDCKDADAGSIQHGTHVAGTAAGKGVLSNGTTFNGPYDASTLSSNDFRIAPGVAPEASILAYRVFGCDGSTGLALDAIERAVRDGADVINMSLGSPFGNPGSADAVAVDNASMGGVTVVMSAGNEGPSAYVVGSPAAATRGIAVAALDAWATFPSVTIDMPTGADITGILANSNTNGLPITGELNVFEDDPGTVCDADTGEGCEESGMHHDSYVYNDWQPGQIPVTFRGNGASSDRAKQGDAEGAPLVMMVSNSNGFPLYVGPIPGVGIPFVGVPSDAAERLMADEGGDATVGAGPVIDNPTYRHAAEFTSGGPRRVDSMIKPDVAAPGVSVISADGGTVAQSKPISGTSMASPAVAGVAALVTQAHPTWTPAAVKAAIVGTASPGKVDPYDERLSGAGVVTPRRAVDTQAYVTTIPGASSLVFGSEELGPGRSGPVSYRETKPFKITNRGSSSITYDVKSVFGGELGFQVSISPTVVTVPAGDSRTVDVTLELDDSDVAALESGAPFHGPTLAQNEFGDLYTYLGRAAGAIVADPRGSGPGIYDLRVPWLIAPRGVSKITPGTKAPNVASAHGFKSSIKVKNHGVHDGLADVYAWGLLDAREGMGSIDVRAAGVQSIDPAACDSNADPDDRCLIFAVNTWTPWSTASENEFDVLVSTHGDSDPEYAVVGVDAGLIFDDLYGVYVSLIIDITTNQIVNVYFAGASANGATVLLPVLASELGLSGTGRFDYEVESYSVADADGTSFQSDIATTGLDGAHASEAARFYAFGHPISNGDFESLDPGQSKTIPLEVLDTRYKPRRGMRGWMIVSLDDRTGTDLRGISQADLIDVGPRP